MEDFANEVSAIMAGVSVGEYTDTMMTLCTKEYLNKLTGIAKRLKKERIKKDNFIKARELNGILSQLSCFTFNNKMDEGLKKEIYDIMEIYSKSMLSAAKKISRENCDTDLRKLVRYVIQSWNYRLENKNDICEALIKGGIVHKKKTKFGYGFYVNGIHCKLGDNTFKVSMEGTEYRCYYDSLLPQVYPVRSSLDNYLSEHYEEKIPLLDESLYNIVYVVNGVGAKHAARVYMGWKDKYFIMRKYCDYV